MLWSVLLTDWLSWPIKLQIMQSKGSKIYRTPFGIRFYLIRAFCFLFLNFLSHKSLRLLTMHNELPTLLTIQVSYPNITILYLQNNTYITYNKGAKQTTQNNSNGILKLTNSAKLLNKTWKQIYHENEELCCTPNKKNPWQTRMSNHGCHGKERIEVTN